MATTDDQKTCCDLHSHTCEPPSELCCRRCTEAAHEWGDAGRGFHLADGTPCISSDHWTPKEVVAGIGRWNEAQLRVAPPDTVWYRPDGTIVDDPAGDDDDRDRKPIGDRIAAWLICPWCLGLRIGPGHLFKRLSGICGGRS